MKFIKLFDDRDNALGEVSTPALFYVKGAPVPMYAGTDRGATVTIVVDDTEGSAGIKPIGITIIFKDNEGNVLSEHEYKSGETIVIPTVPVKEGLTFIGWGDATVDKAVTNMTYIAQYEVTPKVILVMNDSYTDTAAIAMNATKTATVTGEITFTHSLASDVAHVVDNAIIFDKHYEGDVTITAKATDVHGVEKSDSKTITVSCDAADTVECTISDVAAADIAASATTATVTYKCNVKTTTHAGVSSTVVTNQSKVVDIAEGENTDTEDVIRTGSFNCEHGKAVDWSVKQAGKPASPYTAVDLGLSVKWASCNVGATTPEGYGLLFQFGRTDGYAYGDTNHQFRTKEQNITDTGNEYIPLTTSGTTYAAGSTLALVDDAANANMGGSWRMPTEDELSALIALGSTWTTENGVYGRKFTGNGNSIFIPAAGFFFGYNGSFDSSGSFGFIWSSTVLSGSTNSAYYLNFNSSNCNLFTNNRYYGFSVRGVC